MTDIEIAQAHEMKPITEIAAAAGIDEQHLELYGKYKAKLDLYRDPQAAPQGEADPRHRHQPHARGRGQDHHLRRPGRRAQQDRQEDHGLPA